ncbi:hypothetical protein RHE_CH01838 [Rhizobium etli CFN 42]|uniref:Uncharacterized protein n=1 Tax=Rhizobium etli (strain ATCC 51251 / DSM 11541 / JCM 21823 / NBRC 15573 / CFN 42) TaxID=347834 RepID=Q2K955_RHIEC|nr:hypothetical protein RHE_CH01838 [Rhizobium etli CFN 42]
MQFAVGHATEFRDGLTILAPVVERASDVHVKPLSEGLICQQPPIGADLYLMAGIYVAVRRRKTDKFSGHLCDGCNALRKLTAVWSTNRQSDLSEYSTFEAGREAAMRKYPPLAGHALNRRFVAGSTARQSLRWPCEAARPRMRRRGLMRRKIRWTCFPSATE